MEDFMNKYENMQDEFHDNDDNTDKDRKRIANKIMKHILQDDARFISLFIGSYFMMNSLKNYLKYADKSLVKKLKTHLVERSNY